MHLMYAEVHLVSENFQPCIVFASYHTIHVLMSSPPPFRAMPERKHFFLQEGFPYVSRILKLTNPGSIDRQVYNSWSLLWKRSLSSFTLVEINPRSSKVCFKKNYPKMNPSSFTLVEINARSSKFCFRKNYPKLNPRWWSTTVTGAGLVPLIASSTRGQTRQASTGRSITSTWKTSTSSLRGFGMTLLAFPYHHKIKGQGNLTESSRRLVKIKIVIYNSLLLT